MDWFRKTKNTVTVEFIENGTEKPFVVSDVPIEQLPDTFEVETNLEIGQQQWLVVKAIPNIKEDFVKAGKLQVFLNKVQALDPKEILFSLPTINNSLFETESDTSKNIFSIHEDDWRQIEFISEKFIAQIRQEIKSVVEVYENHKVGVGFDKIHIRNVIEQPLSDKNINLEELMHTLNVTKKYDGFGVGANKAKKSFAFQTAEEIIFYGQTNNSLVDYLCISESENLQIIEMVVRKFGVVFVDWCKAEIIE